MAPVYYALRAQEGIDVRILTTGQHREQLGSMLDIFDLTPEHELELMTERQQLPELLGRSVPAVAQVLRKQRPDYVLVHGDTLSTFAASLASYYEGIPVGHVEAGLRSHNLQEPFPEEANRRLTDVLTDIDLPPTSLAKDNLLAEGKRAEDMVITGNTAVDAVHHALNKARLLPQFQGKKLVTITMHRRENLVHLPAMAACLGELARATPHYHFVYPVHLNPAVQEAVYPALDQIPNVELCAPLDYLNMLALMQASELIITDSGGLQEEGSALSIPVVVLRNVTERPEGLVTGSLKLAGNQPEGMRAVIAPLLEHAHLRQAMKDAPNPYGDGQAGGRIARAVAWRLGLTTRPKDWKPS